MPFSGLHVSCHYGGVNDQKTNQLQIVEKAVWSENPASNTLSANSAPDLERGRQPIMRFDVSADSYVAIGKNPDPTVSPRHLMRATGFPQDLAVLPGDKVKWIAVP